MSLTALNFVSFILTIIEQKSFIEKMCWHLQTAERQILKKRQAFKHLKTCHLLTLKIGKFYITKIFLVM